MRLLLISVLLAAFGASAGEPVKVWIDLRDKGPFAPRVDALEGPRAYENAPVYTPYLEELRGAGFAVDVALKWQNRVSGRVERSALAGLAARSFVTRIEEFPRKAAAPPPLPKASLSPGPLSKAGASRFGGFHRAFDSTGAFALSDTLLGRYRRPGEGIRIAVIDEDFYLGHDAFDSLFERHAIVDQWDFVDNVPGAVHNSLGSGSHGGWVLSLLAANLPGTALGLAPYANYQLYRTEAAAFEGYVEEDYLAAALERAVDSGAQVINVSLGYRYDFTTGDPDLPYSAMDGRTRPSTLAALGAARRGALVIVAIGNESTRGSTPTLVAPADADSILTVGITDTLGRRCGYSSTGPSFDGRVKPELVTLGRGATCDVSVVSTGSATALEGRSGTSFAAPVVAGLAVLLRQLHPDSTGVTAQDIRAALIATARHAQSPDSLRGYGLPDAARAHCLLTADTVCGPGYPTTALKGLLVWRGGNSNPMPWQSALDLDRARLWDLRGRSQPLRGMLTDEGDLLLRSRDRLAPGSYLLRVPRLPSAQ